MQVPGFVYVLALLAALLVAWTTVRTLVERNRRVTRTWRAFAAAKGLHEEKPAYPVTLVFTGLHQGCPFVLERRRRRKGNTQQTVTRMHLTLPGLPQGLRLHRVAVLSRLTQALGARGIETGDGEFDQGFTFRASDAEQARRWLTPERRHSLTTQLARVEGLRVLEDGLHWERRGQVAEIQELERVYGCIGELASALVRPWSSS